MAVDVSRAAGSFRAGAAGNSHAGHPRGLRSGLECLAHAPGLGCAFASAARAISPVPGLLTLRASEKYSPVHSRGKPSHVATDPRVCNTGVYNPHSLP